tara:strand:- start:8415 stop:8795 length:381 start_codon:yes stop_codon:yes gene_type:complete
MDKQSKKIDKLVHQLINEAGLENPSSDFFNKVMDKIEAQKVSQPIIFEPLISKKTWLLIISFTIVVITLLTIYPIIDEFSLFQLPSLSNLSFKFPEIHLSKTAVYGIGFLSLFLIQIPFLKKQIDQ